MMTLRLAQSPRPGRSQLFGSDVTSVVVVDHRTDHTPINVMAIIKVSESSNFSFFAP
jgi:hypothetical protein